MAQQFRVGEAKRISYLVTSNAEFTVASVSVAIFDSTGVQISGSPFTGTRDPTTADTEVEVYYLWTPATAGEYSYNLAYVVGSETIEVKGRITVLADTGKFEPYLRRCEDWLLEADMGEAQALLNERQWKSYIRSAVQEYERWWPRLVQKDLTLTAADWEYLLSDLVVGASPAAAWANNFSRILSIEPRVDATVQSRSFLAPFTWSVDEQRAVFRFETVSPSTGDVARITFTVRQTLTDSIDTLGGDGALHFEPLCAYAAGLALLGLANKNAGTTDPGVAADVVGVRDRQLKYKQQGELLKATGLRGWKPQRYYL